MRALMLCLLLLGLTSLQFGCARHTYLVEMKDNKSFYVTPPVGAGYREGRLLHVD